MCIHIPSQLRKWLDKIPQKRVWYIAKSDSDAFTLIEIFI